MNFIKCLRKYTEMPSQIAAMQVEIHSLRVQLSSGEKSARSQDIATISPRNSEGRERRYRSLAQAGVTILISMCALIISLFAFIDQHNVDRSAAAVATRSYAAQVSWWLAFAHYGAPDDLDLIVQNRNPAPIYNVTVYADVSTVWDLPTRSATAVLSLDTIPACTIDISKAPEGAMSEVNRPGGIFGAKPGPSNDLEAYVTEVAFTDETGITWERSSSGALRVGTTYWANDDDAISNIGKFVSLTGCS